MLLNNARINEKKKKKRTLHRLHARFEIIKSALLTVPGSKVDEITALLRHMAAWKPVPSVLLLDR